MAILRAALVDISRIAAFDPVRLCNGFIGNRVKRKTSTGLQIYAIAFIPILKLNWFEIGAVNVAEDPIGHAIDSISGAGITAEIGMKPARATIIDKVDVTGGILIH